MTEISQPSGPGSPVPQAPANETPAARVARLRGLYEAALREVAITDAPYALVDFPFYLNIGDSAIWLGAREALQRLYGRPPDYVAALYLDPVEIGRFVPKGGTIYLLGGGNFGDLWPAHQRYREAIIARYPDRRIVQLPQSIHYDRAENAARTREIYTRHPDLTLMVRDEPSRDFVTRELRLEVQLVPDAAFCITRGLDGLGAPGRPLGALFRQDQERRADAADALTLFPDVVQEDWHGPDPRRLSRGRWMMRFANRLPRMPGLGGTMALRRQIYDRHAADLVQIGFAQLSRSDVIVTDRLHGHILCSLLGRPHVTIDNSYGKITRFCAAWGADNRTRLAADYDAAARLAAELVETFGQAAA